MTFPNRVEKLIDYALSKISFAPDSATVLTPEQRALQVEKVIRSLVRKLLALSSATVAYFCDGCKQSECLNPAHETPMHRHDKTLYILRKET